MHDMGMHYADPFEIREKMGPLTEALSDASAHAVEVGIAVAEAECAARSSLAETARTLEAEYRATYSRRHRADIAAFQRLRLTALQRHTLDLTDSWQRRGECV
jgi:S-methylmethionine-dependent homocysteine/selenocysteine methylase